LESSKVVMDAPKYTHPPIVEAALEFRISGRASDDELVRVQKALSEQYKKVETVSEVVIAISLDGKPPAGPPPNSGKQFRLTSDDGVWIIQVGPTICSISNLAPYVGWAEFEKHARAVWAVWKKHVGKKPLERIGLRYINRVDIPGVVVNPNEWFLMYVEFPDALKLQANEAQSVIAGMFDQNFGVKIATALVPPALIDHLSLVLDIDTFRTAMTAKDDEDIWAAVSELHERKNLAFERCITDKTRALFQ
jgi:uncharacterized protein (TIGR04255 family)